MRISDLSEEPGTYPIVTLISPANGSQVGVAKSWWVVGDKQIPVKLRIMNNTQYNSFTMQTQWTEAGGAGGAIQTAVIIDPGDTKDISQDLTLTNQSFSQLPISLTVMIQPMYTATQPAKEMGVVAQANATMTA